MSKMNNTDFGKMVKIRLIDRDETQSHMADKLGLSRQYLNMVIQGKRQNPAVIKQIEEYLGL